MSGGSHSAPTGLQWDLLGLVVRLEQIQEEESGADGFLFYRVLTCDLPRLRQHITDETWAWALEHDESLRGGGQATKVHLATSGEYSDYTVQHAFARREDAESYALADDVMELEVHDGPVEVRAWHALCWDTALPDRPPAGTSAANPDLWSEPRDFDGRPEHVEHLWGDDRMGRDRLIVEGWDLERVREVYSEQRAQYLARTDMGVEPRTTGADETGDDDE